MPKKEFSICYRGIIEALCQIADDFKDGEFSINTMLSEAQV